MTLLNLFKGKADVAVAVVEEEEDELLFHGKDEVETEEDKAARVRHAELATKLGIRPAYVGERLVDFLKAEAIQIYDRVKVEAYLTKQGTWGWHALREVDKTVQNGSVGAVWPMYQELVPWEVLTTVERIVAKFPNAQFLVAALKKDPDPFLGVLLRGDDDSFHIIERWDEPGFRQ